LRQQQFEADFTTWAIQEVENPFEDEQAIKKLIKDAAEMGDVINDLTADRFVPEWAMYLSRLNMIAPDLVAKRWNVSDLVEDVSTRGSEFQKMLACTQMRCMAMIGYVPVQYGIEREVTGEQRQQLDERWVTFGEHMVGHLANLEEYGTPYWHARTLACLSVYGIIDERPRQWLSPIRDQFCAAATRIERPDWISMVSEVENNTRSVLWLLGY
jgi:hypothetical protein